MPHVSGHKEQTGLMSNPYKQAAESMKSVGIKSLSGATTSSPKGQQAQQKQRESGFKPIRDYNTGPVGGNGNGRWNAGFDDDEESKSWDSLQSNPNKNRILNEVVEKYNESWLGAHNEWGDFEDDLPITQAAKFGTNFLLRATALPFELASAKFVGDPAANIYEGLQEAGYIDPTGTKKTISNKGILGKLPIGGTEYEQPSPFEFGMGAKTTAEIGGIVYSIPSLIKFGATGINAVKNIFNKNVSVKPINISKIDNATTNDEKIAAVNEWNASNPNNRVVDFVDLQAVSAFVKENPKYLYHQHPNIKISKETDNFGIITDKNIFTKDVETEVARIITSGTDEAAFLQNTINNLDESLTKTVLVFNGKTNVPVKIPKIFYHGTTKNFMKFDVNSPKTHSDVGGFNGVTDNIDTARINYAMSRGGPLKDEYGEFLPAGTKEEEAFEALEQIYETPKIFTGTLNVKKLWKLSDENDIELLAHIAATKKWNPDTSPSSIAVLKDSAKWKSNPDKPVDFTLDDFVENPTYNQRYEKNIEFLKSSNPWSLIEDNITYLNKHHGYDAFQTREANRINIMLTDPNNQLIPIHNTLRDKNIQTKEWGNGFETKVNWKVEDIRGGSWEIEMAM